MTTKPDTPQKTAGRPFKRAGRKKVTFQVEVDLLACLDFMTGGKDKQRSEVLNKVLAEALTVGILKKA